MTESYETPALDADVRPHQHDGGPFYADCSVCGQVRDAEIHQDAAGVAL